MLEACKGFELEHCRGLGMDGFSCASHHLGYSCFHFF
jgi:hypothetical protein